MSQETKDVTSGVVTTIGDSDLVMVAGSSGWSPINFGDLAKAVRGTLQIGGRNLIKNSETITVRESGSDVSCFVSLPLTIGVKAGDTFTISLESFEFIKGQGTYISALLRKGLSDAYASMGADVVLSTTKKSGTVTVDTDYANPCLLLYNGQAGSTANKQVRFHKVKIERGNMATDWSPAPEDIASGNWGGG